MLVETDDTGLPAFVFEISQTFASDATSFIKAWNALEKARDKRWPSDCIVTHFYKILL